MDIEYIYDEVQAQDADKAANALSEPGAYVGTFKKAFAITSKEKGTHGIEFLFSAPGSGDVGFTLYTKSADGKPIFGGSFVSAMMYFFKLRSLTSVKGDVEIYDADARARVMTEGDTFPALCGQQIGVVLQKELYTTVKGVDGARLSLIGLYQPETKLMFSELKEGKTKGVKLDRLLSTLKVKDQRRKTSDVDQPSLGSIAGADCPY